MGDNNEHSLSIILTCWGGGGKRESFFQDPLAHQRVHLG